MQKMYLSTVKIRFPAISCGAGDPAVCHTSFTVVWVK